MARYRVPIVVEGRRRGYLIEAPTPQDAARKALTIAGQHTHQRPKGSTAVLEGTPERVA